ncbi:hypothetical protein VLK31_36130, partial [Variovorax sp. H27-G14]|uniref:hypothetical protein n=1 Tax=Variovorax sp. H27-G14 TaxID=3111914 RepID=UPI0038FD37D1
MKHLQTALAAIALSIVAASCASTENALYMGRGKNSKESRLAAANRREELDNSYRESLTRVFNAACGSSELVGA